MVNQTDRNGAVVPNGNILTVGVGKDYSTISAAVAAANDGDTINVDAGTYTNDSALINKKIILEGVGGIVKMVVNNGYPLWHQAPVVVNTDATIVNFDISGSRIDDSLGGNAAAIRFHAGNLTLVNDSIHDNQDGIAAWPDTAGTGSISIFDSEVFNNGNASGPNSGYVHGIYAGNLANLYIENSYFHDTQVGHEIKSRAQNTTIINSTISSDSGTGSYLVDAPNGGNLTISNTLLVKGANAQNPNLIAWAEEGQSNSGNSINLENDTFINHQSAHTPNLILNPTAVTANVTNSSLSGVNLPNSGVNANNDTVLQTQPAYALSSPVNTSGVDWAWGDYSNSIPDPSDPTLPVGTQPSSTPTAPSGTPAATPSQLQVSSNTAYRFFDSVHGTQFLTSDQNEVNQILSARPDLKFEGAAFTTAAQSDPSASAVYRFFDSVYGTHFYTTDKSEMQTVQATRADLKYEGVGFYEHAAQGAGDGAVYRFFDSNMGTHFFTSNQTEVQTIMSTRPDLVSEGIAFYTPHS